MASSTTPSGALRLLNRGAWFVAIISLAITLVAAGFSLCAAFPQTTELLANAVSGIDNPDTPFSHEDLVEAAVVTRNYTVDTNDRSEVFSMLHSINENANTRYATADDTTLAQAPDIYTLTSDALSHLDDVYAVVSIAKITLIIIAIVALASLGHVAFRMGKRELGQAIQIAGVAILGVFALLALWVVVDFNGFFAAFHSLFFTEGTWTFSYESLLITMYPPAFWMGMGAVWLAGSAGLSILCVVVGRLLKRSA